MLHIRGQINRSKLSLLFIFCASLLITSCENGDEYAIVRDPPYSDRKMDNVELNAHKRRVEFRRDQLHELYDKLRLGMTSDEVISILGNPDIKHRVYKLADGEESATYSIFFSLAVNAETFADISNEGIATYYDRHGLLFMVEPKNINDLGRLGEMTETVRYIRY